MTLGDRLSMPTQKSVGHDSHAASIDNFNRQMRAQPWYQNWFRSQGLDPNHVHLSQGQRQQLEQVVLQQPGIPHDAFNDMMIDPAGNLNTEHGFASQPTWLKTLEIAGAAGAAIFGPGAIVSAGGWGGGGTTAGTTSATTAAHTAIPTLTAVNTGAPIIAAGAPAVATGGGGTAAAVAGGGSLLARAAPMMVNAGMNLYAQHNANQSNQRASDAQLQAGRDSIAYMEARDKQARQDALDAQALNLKLYNESLARRAPLRQFGERSLAQLGQPIPGVGSLGARMGV